MNGKSDEKEKRDIIVHMKEITKEFPGIKANDNVNLELRKSEIHALLGENGAGKSTLMSVLFGLYQQEKGDIFVNGKKVKINGPGDANALGIGMVHQHFMLVEDFTVLENIILGVEITKNGVLQKNEAKKEIMELSEQYGLKIDPDAKISEITVGMQQRVEILKMLYRQNEILIFDEPTAVLTPQEIDDLMKIMDNLRNEGKSILFITHKLEEIMQVCDRCSVLRRGKYMGTVDIENVTKEELSEMMVGREVVLTFDKREPKIGEVKLKVENLTVEDKKTHHKLVNNVSFDVHGGEIVCIAGIDGNGQSELVYAITGLMPPTQGKVFLDNVDISHTPIRKRNLAGIGHIPEDRHRHGLILDYNLAYNLVLQRYFKDEFSKNGFLKFDEIYKYSDALIEKFDIRSGQGSVTNVGNMSGGNQQKAIIAREIDRDPEVLVTVQPARGLDVGAIEYIHKQIVNQRDQGKAVLLVSLELEEVMNLSDRILVMYEGEIVADVKPKDITFKDLGLYMAGAKRGME